MFCLQAFHRWSAPVVNAGQPPVKPKRTKKAIDVSAMAAGTPVKDQDRGRTFDDGASGDLTIWKIEKFDKVLLDQSDHGTFHAGDSYIVQYDYGSSKKDHVIYFWQGRDSTADEKGASALLATALSDSLGGQVPIIRVPMGKEPDHFYSLFKGRMVVRSGGVAGGFRNTDEKDTSAESAGVALFHVRGTDDVNTRAVQGEFLFVLVHFRISICISVRAIRLMTRVFSFCVQSPPMHPRSTRAIASYSRWTAGRFRVWTVSPGCSRGTDAVALGMSDRAPRSSRVPSWRPPSAWRRRRWKSWTRDQNQTRSGRRSVSFFFTFVFAITCRLTSCFVCRR